MKFIQLVFLSFITTFGFGQSLTNEIDDIYNFSPGKLTDKEQALKMPSLDKFWEKIKSDTSKYLPELRLELAGNGHNPYFYYDGSGLLLSLANNKADKAIAIESISKCDIRDISQQIFVMTLNHLANEGLDVTKAAIKILDADKYSFFIAQHALIFTREYCLAYMLLPQQNESYIDSLIGNFTRVKPESQKAIITTLWLAYSCKGDIFLKSIAGDKTLAKEVRGLANKIMENVKLSKDEQAYIKTLNIDQLENLRTEALKRFSDEALDELGMTTRIMRQNNNCR